MADKETCDQLLEEYRMLRRRTEEVRQYTDFQRSDLEHVDVSQADLDRLAEVKKKLSEECEAFLPAEEKMDIERDNGF